MLINKVNEIVLRDITHDGKVTIPGALIRRSICEELIGVNGKTCEGNTKPILVARTADYTFWITSPKIRHQNPAYGVFQMNTLPMDACMNILSTGDKGMEIRKFITPDQTKPRIKFTITNPEYQFFLAIGPAGYASYLWGQRKSIKEDFSMGLPNTWEDGRACLGEELDAFINEEGQLSHSKIWKIWAKSQYNNHIVTSDTDTLRHFWSFTPNLVWTPDYRYRSHVIQSAISDSVQML